MMTIHTNSLNGQIAIRDGSANIENQSDHEIDVTDYIWAWNEFVLLLGTRRMDEGVDHMQLEIEVMKSGAKIGEGFNRIELSTPSRILFIDDLSLGESYFQMKCESSSVVHVKHIESINMFCIKVER